MRFVLCARDPLSGAAALVGGQAYATRAEATDALAMQGSLSGLEGRELFLVDLEAATAVVVVAPGGAAAAVPSATEPAEEAEAPVSAVEWPFLTPGVAGGVGPSTLTADRVEDDADLASVWWLEAGVVEQPAPAPSDEGADAAAEPLDAARESDGQASGAVEPTSPEPTGEGSTEVAEAATVEPEPGTERAAETLPSTTETVTEPAAVSEEGDVTNDVPEYVPVMSVDFEAWTCSDCIFVVTCPQSGTGRPATCGSFQWRPE